MRGPPFISRHQLVVFLVCVAIFALGQFHRASGGVFTPILIDRYSLSAAQVGSLVSAMFLASLVAQVPLGAALDRLGPRRVLAFCLLLVAGGTALFALEKTVGQVLTARIFIGLGLAAMGAASHVIIARNFAQRDFGYVSGLVVTLGGVGGLLGTFPLALALSRLNWPVVFGAIALLTLLLTLAIFFAIRPGPAAEGASKAANGSFLTLLKQPEFLKILTLAMVTYAPITTISGLWGGPYLQEVAGLDPESAGAVLMLFFVATISAGSVFGLLDRHAPSRRLVVLGGAGLSVTSLGMLCLIDRPSPTLAVGLLLAMVFCQQFYIPLGAHMRRIVPQEMMGRASTLFALFAVAAIPTMQTGFGALLDLGARLGLDGPDSYRLAFGGMGTSILLCALVYSTARRVNDPVKGDEGPDQ